MIVESNVTLQVSTYEDVSRMFGTYEVWCEQPTPTRADYRCTYDITGRGPNANIWYNSVTNLVESIRVTSCN